MVVDMEGVDTNNVIRVDMDSKEDMATNSEVKADTMNHLHNIRVTLDAMSLSQALLDLLVVLC